MRDVPVAGGTRFRALTRGSSDVVTSVVSHPRDTVPSMDAATWTLIAILGASALGSFFYLGSRIDGLGEKIDAQGAELGARIDAQSAELGARIDGQGTELGRRIDAQSVALGSRIDALSGRVDSLESRLDARLDALASRLDDHILRHAG
jgi:hypothetical protein